MGTNALMFQFFFSGAGQVREGKEGAHAGRLLIKRAAFGMLGVRGLACDWACRHLWREPKIETEELNAPRNLRASPPYCNLNVKVDR